MDDNFIDRCMFAQKEPQDDDDDNGPQDDGGYDEATPAMGGRGRCGCVGGRDFRNIALFIGSIALHHQGKPEGKLSASVA